MSQSDTIGTGIHTLRFSGGSEGKESACNAGDLDSVPRLGRPPGEGHGNPLQYSCLENSQGQRSLEGCSPWGRKELDTSARLSTYIHLWGHYHSQDSTLTVRTVHMSTIPEVLFLSSLLLYAPPLPSPGNHWSAFCPYIRTSIKHILRGFSR